MATMEEPVYENHLKKEYAVEKGADSFIITSTSCYWVGEESLWLISVLPPAASKQQYLHELAGLGITETQKIFDKLVSLGVLRLKAPTQRLKQIASYLLNPNVKLLPAQLQHKLLGLLNIRLSPGVLKPAIKPLLVLSAVGLALGLVMTLTGLSGILVHASKGQPHFGLIFLLILFGSLLHELGHSFVAAASGIGLRPVGFSVYLFYPVFYTNVSGMEKLPLWEKVAIDCGGFIFQSAYLFALLAIWLFTRNISYLESIRWIALIMAFNINPLLRTDGYWLYQDLRKSLGDSKVMNYVHYLYLAAFVIFSVYIFSHIYSSAGTTANFVIGVVKQPARLLHDGYKIVLGCYFMIMAFVGGMRRFKESHQEWVELRKVTAPVNPKKILEPA
jgi:hypothetical protein